MSANKSQPHILILPEDRANEQLATGFQLEVGQLRQVRVLRVAGGWGKVLNEFQSTHVIEMRRCTTRFMILMIDFDNDISRLRQAIDAVPKDLSERVFVIGVLTEPEDLRADLGKLEGIGAALASDCRRGAKEVWDHRLLRHNTGELERLRLPLCPILFPTLFR